MNDPQQQTDIWNGCLTYIEERLPRQIFYTWLKPVRLTQVDDHAATVCVPNRFVAGWIKDRYLALIDEALQAVTGRTIKTTLTVAANGNGLEFLPPPLPERESSTSDDDDPGRPDMPAPSWRAVLVRDPSEGRARAQLNPDFTFDNFVVGESNRLAHAASRAVADNPGRTKYNPLFIYGPVGMGKTHLAHAIGNALNEKGRRSRVLYAASETFVNDFINSLAQKRAAEFATYYRSVDVLLIDDIQFLAGKESTQEQFFHTFNTLHQNGKQLVLTADRPPHAIAGLEERLLSRFQWGLTADIGMPDYETRLAILRKKIDADTPAPSHDVLEYIAQNASASIRQLEGALVRVVAYGSLQKQPVTLDVARRLLKDSMPPARKLLTIERIRAAVAHRFNVPESLLVSKRRTQEVAIARQVVMYLARTLTGMSLKAIGRALGGRDHSTVIHAVKLVRDTMDINGDFRCQVDETITDLHREAA